jgi:hypothetical protein
MRDGGSVGGARKEFNMKSAQFGLLVMVCVSLIGCTATPDRILLKERGADNRCHMKIETYGDPAMPTEREVVDYYGDCDERPGPRVSREKE